MKCLREKYRLLICAVLIGTVTIYKGQIKLSLFISYFSVDVEEKFTVTRAKCDANFHGNNYERYFIIVT